MNDQPRIVTRCPSCGAQSLFIGSGGHLTCSVVGCLNPSVAVAIAVLQAESAAWHAIDGKRNDASAYCDEWGIHDCGVNLWHAVLVDAQRMRRGLRQLLTGQP